MTKVKAYNVYQREEELANALTHGLGALLSIAALVLMVIKASGHHSVTFMASTLSYGLSLLFLYLTSTLYHSIQTPRLRNVLNKMDHMAIYVLIAGTYTPFTQLVLQGTGGRVVFAIVWSMALLGIVLKLFFFGRYNTLSAIAYVVMGWIIVFFIKSLYLQLGLEGTALLFGGGLFYTAGAGIYLWQKLPFNHAIFHLFVLAGSLMHFLSVYLYVL